MPEPMSTVNGTAPDDTPTMSFDASALIEAGPAPAVPVEAAAAASEPERVVCPECGTAAVVTLNRRDAVDFCKQCDFPLFWTPSAIVRDEAARANDESLRRLPGTVGRVTVASLPCPHCAEPNLLSAQTCVRCGLPMRLTAQAPVPVPVYVAPPPVPVADPENRVPWWVWAAIAIILAATIALIVLGVTGVIG